MLTDFLNTLLQVIGFIWPLAIVHQWERALYSVNGKMVTPWRWVAFSWRRLEGLELPPGIYLKCPFFSDVHTVAVSWDFVTSGRLDLTLKDGRGLSCEATAKMRVTDLYAAWVAYHDYELDRKQLLRAAISETLLDADVERFDPARRGRLLGGSLLGAVRAGASGIGHEVESVQVTTFVLGAKTFRLLTEQTSAAL